MYYQTVCAAVSCLQIGAVLAGRRYSPSVVAIVPAYGFHLLTLLPTVQGWLHVTTRCLRRCSQPSDANPFDLCDTHTDPSVSKFNNTHYTTRLQKGETAVLPPSYCGTSSFWFYLDPTCCLPSNSFRGRSVASQVESFIIIILRAGWRRS